MKVKDTDVDLTGAQWFKSSRSGAAGHCVEAAFLENHQVGLRDSKDPSGTALKFTSAAFSTFIAGVKAGQFDQR